MLWLGIKTSRRVLTILLTRPHCPAHIRGSCSQHWHFITHNKTYLQLVIWDHENIGGLMRTIWIRVTINIITHRHVEYFWKQRSCFRLHVTAWFVSELIGADRGSSCWPSQGPEENCSSWVSQWAGTDLTSSFISIWMIWLLPWWSGIILAIIIHFLQQIRNQKVPMGIN